MIKAMHKGDGNVENSEAGFNEVKDRMYTHTHTHTHITFLLDLITL